MKQTSGLMGFLQEIFSEKVKQKWRYGEGYGSRLNKEEGEEFAFLVLTYFSPFKEI